MFEMEVQGINKKNGDCGLRHGLLLMEALRSTSNLKCRFWWREKTRQPGQKPLKQGVNQQKTLNPHETARTEIGLEFYPLRQPCYPN